MVTSNPLSKILQGLMRRSSDIGTIYSAEKQVETVEGKTSAEVTHVKVPAGTYVIVANTEWNLDLDVFAVSVIRVGGGVPAVERYTMKGGGGASLAVVSDLSTETKIAVEVYHEHTAPVGIWTRLQAIRIK